MPYMPSTSPRRPRKPTPNITAKARGSLVCKTGA
jgi:hypothetical protein